MRSARWSVYGTISACYSVAVDNEWSPVHRRYDPAVPKRQLEEVAVAWALAEVAGQLRDEPAHRLTVLRTHSWSLTAPNNIGVSVEVVRVEGFEAATVELDLSAVAMGLLPGHVRAQRRLLLPLGGHAAREPELLYLVFEIGGHVYAFERLQDAGDSLEGVDLQDYIGAFSDQGEVIAMSPGDWIDFTPTGTFDQAALRTLISSSRIFSELKEDPHRFALAIWRAS